MGANVIYEENIVIPERGRLEGSDTNRNKNRDKNRSISSRLFIP